MAQDRTNAPQKQSDDSRQEALDLLFKDAALEKPRTYTCMPFPAVILCVSV